MRSIHLVCVAAIVGLSAFACGGPDLEEVSGEVEQAVGDNASALVVPWVIEGKWYKLVDSFTEQCGAGTLAVAAAPGVTNLKTYIPRGVTTIVPHYWWSTNGWFRWWCGGTAERAECNDPPGNDVDKRLRITWSTTSRAISIQCFEKCGSGSSSSQCY